MSTPYDDKKDGPLLAAHMEDVAREEAARTGFDIANEPHGLFRALATVLARPDLLKEAIRRTKAHEPAAYEAQYRDIAIQKQSPTVAPGEEEA
jgi:hypothetical protein